MYLFFLTLFQIILTVCQIFWVRDVHLILDSTENVIEKMKEYEKQCYEVYLCYI